MKLVVEISMYPLKDEYIAPIKGFIERLNAHDDLKVSTSATSTLVSGEYQAVMSMLGQEMQAAHEAVGQAIFVCKFLNGDKMSQDV